MKAIKYLYISMTLVTLAIISWPALPEVVSPNIAQEVSEARAKSNGLSEAEKKRARKLLFEAFELYKAGDFEAAKVGIARALSIDPAEGRAHFYFAEILREQKNLIEARKQYSLAKELSPDSSEGIKAEVWLTKFASPEGIQAIEQQVNIANLSTIRKPDEVNESVWNELIKSEAFQRWPKMKFLAAAYEYTRTGGVHGLSYDALDPNPDHGKYAICTNRSAVLSDSFYPEYHSYPHSVCVLGGLVGIGKEVQSIKINGSIFPLRPGASMTIESKTDGYIDISTIVILSKEPASNLATGMSGDAWTYDRITKSHSQTINPDDLSKETGILLSDTATTLKGQVGIKSVDEYIDPSGGRDFRNIYGIPDTKSEYIQRWRNYKWTYKFMSWNLYTSRDEALKYLRDVRPGLVEKLKNGGSNNQDNSGGFSFW
jgi:tetratricopeptide (TPR) repeat protein